MHTPILDNAMELRVASVHQYVTIFDVFERMGLTEPEETHQMRCPFHADTSPSARVYADQNKLYCFTCQKSWDVIAAVQDHWHKSFADAVQWLEQEFGVPSGANGLIGAVRATLSHKVVPGTEAAVQLVEQALVARKHQLGFTRYSKLLYALDLTVWELAERRIKAPEFQQRLTQLLGAARD